jgi:hypothetical protein
MTDRVIKGSRAKGVLLLVVGLALTGMGVFLLRGDADKTIAWLCVGFFGLCSLVAAAIVVQPGEVRLGRDRFTVKSLGRSFDVAWDDIEGFHVWKNPYAHQSLAAWTYKPGRRPSGALAQASANLGAEGAMPGMLKMSTPDLVALLNSELEARRA